MGGWIKAAGAGIGYYLGGPVGALVGYFLGRAMGNRTSHSSIESTHASFYQILEVSPKAGVVEIKQSYRRLVKRYHPDAHGQLDEKRAIGLREKMAKINEAYAEIRRERGF